MARTRTARRLCLAPSLLLAVVLPAAGAAQTSQTSSPSPSSTTTATQPPAAPAASQRQPPPPPPPPDLSGVPLSLDRIREGVQREPRLQFDFLDPNTPVFRVSVEERELELEDRWKVRDTAVWKGVGPSFGSAWHHEFLSMTTPKQHIAASPFGVYGNPIHPVGVPVLAIGSAIKTAWNKQQRAQIRRQVQEEVRVLEANARKAEAEKAAAEENAKTPPR